MGATKSRSNSIQLTSNYSLNEQSMIKSKYHISHKLIGKGAFAEVFKGSLVADSRTKVAVKCYKKKRLFDKELKAVQAEVDVLSKLDHPNIVKLLDVCQDDKYIYVVMSYAKGQTLADWTTKNDKPMSEADAAQVIHQLASALSYCHANGVVHRDVKLDNIVVDSDLHVTLIDFGLSKVCSKNKQLKSAAGSPLFMAPEAMARKYSNKCDVWSLGVVMYVLLTKRLPFSGESQAELQAQFKACDLAFDSNFWKPISTEAKDLVSNMIKYNDKDRLTCDKLLKHEWFEACKDDSTEDSFESSESCVIEQLARLSCDKSFTNAVVAVLSKTADKLCLETLCQELSNINSQIDEFELLGRIRAACKLARIVVSKRDFATVLESIQGSVAKTPKPKKSKTLEFRV